MNESKDSASKVNPPYISQNILKPFFEKMQKVKKPNDLSATTIKEYGLGGGQVPALQSALKFLRLIDENVKTTDAFNKIQVTGEQFKKNLAEIINAAYEDLINKHPLDHASYEEIVNYFAHKYSPASAKKMAKSLAVLCQIAGMNSPAFSKMRSIKGPTRRENGGKIREVQIAGKSRINELEKKRVNPIFS